MNSSTLVPMNSIYLNLQRIQAKLRDCRKCPNVCDTPVHGPVLHTQVMLIGQAPGVHEASRAKPFAHTAGKTLFKWLADATGDDESIIRDSIYFSAVTRCFPGKAASGAGDRLPSASEIENCREHLSAEVLALKPKLILAVGRLAIFETLNEKQLPASTKLADIIGKKFHVHYYGVPVDVIPLPHPSGVSRWPQTEPGKTKLRQALNLIRKEYEKYR